MLKVERVYEAKIRWGLLTALNTHAIFLFLFRLVVGTLGYFFDLSDDRSFSAGAGIMQSLIVLWPLAFVPTRYFTRPINYVKKLLVIKSLVSLKHTLEKLPVELSSPASFSIGSFEYVSQPDLCMHKLLVILLDYQAELKQQEFSQIPEWLSEFINTSAGDYSMLADKWSKIESRHSTPNPQIFDRP